MTSLVAGGMVSLLEFTSWFAVGRYINVSSCKICPAAAARHQGKQCLQALQGRKLPAAYARNKAQTVQVLV